ncbi:MAG: killing trait family protein [Alphaproteobacteria bacterium]|nr:MAG: killing trait family protein [Alphaproteobacteria bacterium]
MAMTYVAMAGSIGIAMQNAVVNQQNGQRVATAAVVQVCAMMLAAGIAEATHG